MTNRSRIVIAASLAALFELLATTPVVLADIFQWEYINAADPSQGTQQSTTLAPGGAGATAVPGADLSSRNLTKAYLIGADLSPYVAYDDYGYISGYARSNLMSANLSQADLSHARLNAATLTGANFTGAEVRGANFDRYDQYGYSFTYGYGTGVTLQQLTSTASHAARDLSGISLGMTNLAGANFSGFNLTDARFAGADLTNVNFSHANLTGASISGTLTGMNLTGAEVRGANLWGVTKSQLYSTASYQADDLTGIYLYSDQSGWNFAGKNMPQVTFQSSINLNNANFAGANLTNAALSYVTLKNTNFSQADLTNAVVDYATLTGASMAGAIVRGANFNAAPQYPGSGLTLAQLYSTSSFQSHDLTGMGLRHNVLTGGNFAGRTLMNVDFTGASLEGADLTGAEVRGALFHRDQNGQGGITPTQLQATASYQLHDLSGIGLGGHNLAGVNLAGQNLTNANFESLTGQGANLSGADLSQANLSNVRLGYSRLAGAKLVGAFLGNLDLSLTEMTGADLRGADASNSNFGGSFIVIPGEEGGYYHFPGTNLSGANLSSANLTNANFAGTEDYVFGFPHPGADLTNADLRSADARGADFQYTILTGANTTNLIHTNGHIAGLNLTEGKSLVVRDYDGNPAAGPPIGPLPVDIEQHLTMDATGTLRLVFEDDPWDSTISFAPGIPVRLGGTLELTFAPDVDVAAQTGRMFDLFDWTGVSPTSTFNISSPYTWNISNLYTTGEVSLAAAPALAGDYNQDGTVDAADYVAWRKQDGSHSGYNVWRATFGQTASGAVNQLSLGGRVPEPTSLALLTLCATLLLWRKYRPSTRSVYAALALCVTTMTAHADIFQWKYVNPADPAQGKQQSTMLAPDGAGVNAVAGANLSDRDLRTAYLIGFDISNAAVWSVNLSSADLSQTNATNANFYHSNLTGATLTQTNFTNADLRGVSLLNANLHQANLTSANLSFDSPVGAVDLTAADLSQANLTNASLWGAKLSGANLTGADVRGTVFHPYSDGVSFSGGLTLPQLYSTVSYQAHDLSGIVLYDHDLTGVDFAGQNLIGATFVLAKLAGADFTGALVRGAELTGTSGFTKAQLYSTASYQAHDLRGIGLGSNKFEGIDLSGQDLTDAYLWGTVLTNADLNHSNLANADLSAAVLTGANLSQANLSGADFDQAQLTGANVTGADVRGANFAYSGLTAAQLYSTASYESGELTGIGLAGGDFTGASFARKNLASASFFAVTLTNADFSHANLANASLLADLTNASLSQANLTNANVSGNLTSANLTGAEVRGASFSAVSPNQLASTASYQAHDLTGIRFDYCDLSGANFVGQNLANAFAYETNLSNADFSDANLENASIHGTLTGAIFTGARVRHATFDVDQATGLGGLTPAQLYATASYQAHDLTGIQLIGSFLVDVGVNLQGQNLTDANFYLANLSGANLSGATLTNTDLIYATLTDADLHETDLTRAKFTHDFGAHLKGANLSGVNAQDVNFQAAHLTGADLGGADVRGANFQYAELDGANTSNLIQSDGHIAGLSLTAGETLVVRDYDGNPAASPPNGPLPIFVEQHAAMDATATMRLVFDDDHWDSTISFKPGIPVTLGSTLELTFADYVDVATQVGRTFELFNWTGVTQVGTFNVSSPYAWDLSNLYTTGEVTLTAVPEPAAAWLTLLLCGGFFLRRGHRRHIGMPKLPITPRGTVGFAFFTLPLVFLASPARAEWKAINLHPAGEPAGSFLFGVADGQQVGVVHRFEDQAARAGLWSGTADSYVSLNPPELLSLSRGVSQGKQAGYLDSINFQRHAVIWSGAAESYVDLHPAGAHGSAALGIGGNQQVGEVILDDLSFSPHASLWSGTAASWVDLHPAGARVSAAYGTDGKQQVGSAAHGDDHGRASLWTGTAASWVDLEPATPPGSFPIEVSVANAVYGGQQVGTVTYFIPTIGTSIDHAGYWSGSADTWVDLNPDPTSLFTESKAWGVFGGYQVGQAFTTFDDDNGYHAAFWAGTPESWVDLESFLPANYVGSIAYGVWTDGNTIYVAGGAFNNTLNRTEAILWTNSAPEPSSIALLAIGLPLLASRKLLHRNDQERKNPLLAIAP